MEVANRFGNDSGLMGKKFVFIAGAVVLIAAMFGGTVGNLRIFHRSSSTGGAGPYRAAEDIEKD